MLKKILFFSAMLLVLSTLGACKRQYQAGELASGIDIGGTYFTQFSLFQEKNEFRTTNYRRGSLIPINTQVELISIDRKHIQLRVTKTAQPLTIENVEKHTGEDSQQAFKKILGKRKVDLSRFTAKERENIFDGRVAVGMRRNAVLAAIGYPPQTETPSLKADEWTYWASRFDRFVVRFRDDQVSEIRN